MASTTARLCVPLARHDVSEATVAMLAVTVDVVHPLVVLDVLLACAAVGSGTVVWAMRTAAWRTAVRASMETGTTTTTTMGLMVCAWRVWEAAVGRA